VSLLRVGLILFLVVVLRNTNTPILAQPDIEKPFDVFYDASGTRLGCVLMQEGRVIAYVVRQL
jgi:hypothetical protein